MRRLQQRRRNAPIEAARLSFNQRAEIHDLHLRERAHQECHEVADFVSNRVVSLDVIGNPQKMALYKDAIERFRERIPPNAVRIFVDAAIKAELHSRAEVAAEKRKMRRSAEIEAMVS